MYTKVKELQRRKALCNSWLNSKQKLQGLFFKLRAIQYYTSLVIGYNNLKKQQQKIRICFVKFSHLFSAYR